jgi:predicted RNase H-like nuclease (RuvC/YqgF family)
MFRWICLAVGVVFLAILAWLVNDVRLEIRRSGQIVQTAGQTINEQLPTIVEKTRRTTDTLAEELPEIVDKTRATTETLAELAEDIRQLKELAGVSTQGRDKSLVAYANSVLDSIETSGGTIGLKKGFGAKGLKNPVPSRE